MNDERIVTMRRPDNDLPENERLIRELIKKSFPTLLRVVLDDDIENPAHRKRVNEIASEMGIDFTVAWSIFQSLASNLDLDDVTYVNLAEYGSGDFLVGFNIDGSFFGVSKTVDLP